MNIQNLTQDQLQALIAQMQPAVIEFPRLKKSGQPEKVIENTQEVLLHHGITVRYNEMSKREEITIPGVNNNTHTWDNTALTRIYDLCVKAGYEPGENMFFRHIAVIAEENRYHPVREWIDQQTWSGVSQLPKVYASVELTSYNPMKETILRKWLLSLVAAIYHPNFSCEGVLTFTGKQGIGKTTWIERLLPKHAVNVWNKDAVVLDMKSKDSLFKSFSYWIIELGELDATFNKQRIEELKGFITEKQDVLRSPYDRKSNTYPRQTVMFGTVNDTTFLKDTENRRFWVLDVERFNRADIDVADLWAEVKQMYLNYVATMKPVTDRQASDDYGWFMNPDERKILAKTQEKHRSLDPIEEMLDTNILPCDPRLDQMEPKRNVTDILTHCGLNPGQITARHTTVAGKWLIANGFSHVDSRRNFQVRFASQHYDADRDPIKAKVIALGKKMK